MLSDEKTFEVDEVTGEVVEVKPKAKKPASAVVPYEGTKAELMFMSTSGFELIQRWGNMLAKSQMVPEHLKDAPADCALVVSQAIQWGLNPLIVAQSSYVARGRVGYEGKLIASLVNRGLSKKLNYKFTGSGKNLHVVVSGRMKNEDEDRVVEGSWEDWSNDRNPAWKTMPNQMMVYRGAREWARRHNPGVISGIMSIDEVQDLEARDTTVSIDNGPVGDAIDDIVGETGIVEAEVVNKTSRVEKEVDEDEDVKSEKARAAKAAKREAGRPKRAEAPTGKTESKAGASVDDLFD